MNFVWLSWVAYDLWYAHRRMLYEEKLINIQHGITQQDKEARNKELKIVKRVK